MPPSLGAAIPPSIDPGWYSDPEDQSRARYWDGEAWTGGTRALGAGTYGEGTGDSAAGALWRRGRWALLGLTLVVVLGAGYLTLGRSDAEAEVILQPTASKGSDPFTKSVANEKVRKITRSGAKLAGGPVKQVNGGDRRIEAVDGAAPGLYGGTEKQAACDPKAMVGFLKRNPDKAQAFAGVIGIEPDGIADYVAKLTPVVLREDTRVTNHGFKAGRATSFEAVLQAGTAVMVDQRGVPRVRCACGNPLTEPVATKSKPTYSGRRWDRFDRQRLAAVSGADKRIKKFTLVNVRTGKRYTQPAGGSEQGPCIFVHPQTDAPPSPVRTSGDVSCEEAKAVLTRLNDPSTTKRGAGGGFADVGAWACNIPTAGLQQTQGYSTRCVRGKDRIVLPLTSSGTIPPVGGSSSTPESGSESPPESGPESTPAPKPPSSSGSGASED